MIYKLHEIFPPNISDIPINHFIELCRKLIYIQEKCPAHFSHKREKQVVERYDNLIWCETMKDIVIFLNHYKRKYPTVEHLKRSRKVRGNSIVMNILTAIWWKNCKGNVCIDCHDKYRIIYHNDIIIKTLLPLSFAISEELSII